MRLGTLRKIPVKRLAVILAGVAGLAVLSMSGLFVDRIPPQAATSTRMNVLKRLVLQYAQSHGQLPAALDAVSDRIQDAWKRDIHFEVSGGVIVFRSLGRDGTVGGGGEDADIVRSFPSHDTQGRWSNEFVDWTEETRRR